MLTVRDITNWGNSDIATLENWIGVYAKLIGDKYDHRAISFIKSAIAIEHEFPVTEINTWYHTTLTLIFYHITTNIKRTHKDNAELMSSVIKLEQNFSPYINALASSFSNCFDYIDFEKPSEEILKQVITSLSGGGHAR